jgi:hypothetical protein
VTQLLNPLPGSEAVINETARIAVANAVNIVFVIAFIAALLGLLVTLFSPYQELKDRQVEKERAIVSAD